MTHKDRLFAAASGQPQTQGEKNARHGAYAGATTTAEDASDAAANPKTEAPTPSPALTTPLEAASDARLGAMAVRCRLLAEVVRSMDAHSQMSGLEPKQCARILRALVGAYASEVGGDV